MQRKRLLITVIAVMMLVMTMPLVAFADAQAASIDTYQNSDTIEYAVTDEETQDGAASVDYASDESYSLIVIEDEEVPLAQIPEPCCGLHLMIMLLALVVSAVFIKINRDRQLHVFELEDELIETRNMFR